MRASFLRTIFMQWSGLVAGVGTVAAQESYANPADFAAHAKKLREAAIHQMEPATIIPTSSRPLSVSGKYPWKMGITTTTFWVGSSAGQPPRHDASCWDTRWLRNFGGYDDPHPLARRNFIPAKFVPRQNPFYIALPYNDVAGSVTKPEAKVVIPWFREVFTREGASVCHNRWVAVRSSTGKVSYAQWSDCGPYQSDHWQYVFGNEKPKPNANQGTGLNVSPAVRDYLGLEDTDVVDWKFMEFRDVPRGPWSLYGNNNEFILQQRSGSERIDAANASPESKAPEPAPRLLLPRSNTGPVQCIGRIGFMGAMGSTGRMGSIGFMGCIRLPSEDSWSFTSLACARSGSSVSKVARSPVIWKNREPLFVASRTI